MLRTALSKRLLFSALFLSFASWSQGLKDDYQALDDLPPDDVVLGTNKDGSAPDFAPSPTPSAPAKGSSNLSIAPEDPLSTLPTDNLTGVVSEASGALTALEFKQLQDRVRLTLRADRPLDYGRDPRPKRRQMVVELRNVGIAKNLLKRALDTGEFEGPVALVQAFDSRSGTLPTVKVLFQLRKFVDPIITRSGSDLYIDFPIVVGNKIYQSRATAETLLPETFISPTDKITFIGSRISLNVKDADLQDVLALISKSSGRNFVVAGGQSTKVTLSVKNTPWDQVLVILLLNSKLGYQKMGDVYRIAPIDQLQSEIANAAKAEEDKQKLSPVETRLFNLSYAKAEEVEPNIRNLLSKDRGKTVVDKRTNSLAATDTPESLDRIERYIRAVDLQTPMVSIEGRIVEAKDTFQRTFNLAWKTGPIAGASANSRLSDGALNLATPPDTTNLIGGGASGGGGLLLSRLGDFGAVAATLGVFEKQGKTKNIASPKVVVANNESATISQGLSVLIPAPVSQAGQTPTLTPFNLFTSLGVTPRVSNDGFITLDVDFSRDSLADATSDNPTADKKSIKTKLLLENGKTGVIGGVYIQDENKSNSGWPFFKDLPLIGFLFKNDLSKTKTTGELLIFLSARVLNADRALMSQVVKENESGFKDDFSSSLKNQSTLDELEESL